MYGSAVISAKSLPLETCHSGKEPLSVSQSSFQSRSTATDQDCQELRDLFHPDLAQAVFGIDPCSQVLKEHLRVHLGQVDDLPFDERQLHIVQ